MADFPIPIGVCLLGLVDAGQLLIGKIIRMPYEGEYAEEGGGTLLFSSEVILYSDTTTLWSD